MHRCGRRQSVACRALSLPQLGFSSGRSRHTTAQGLAVLTGLFWLFLIEVMPPRLGEYLWYLILGLPLGFGYGFWRHKNVQHKNENIDKARRPTCNSHQDTMLRHCRFLQCYCRACCGRLGT